MIRDDFRYNVAIDVVLFSLLVIVSTFELKLGIVGRIASWLVIPFVLSYLITLMSVVSERLKGIESPLLQERAVITEQKNKKNRILRKAAKA